MNPTRWNQTARAVTLLAGLMDTLTGLGLLIAPALTLRAMLAPMPGSEALIYVRFIGAFVFAVGAVYLLAWRRGEAGTFKSVFQFMIPVVATIGLFTGGAVLAGGLSPAWLSVTFTDLLLAGLQVWLLQRAP